MTAREREHAQRGTSKRSKAVTAFAIALMFIAASALLFGNGDNDEDATIGANAMINITGMATVDDIIAAIEAECIEGNIVTIIGALTGMDKNLEFDLNGATVIWKADYGSTHNIRPQGPGSFELHEEGSLTLNWFGTTNGCKMTINGEVTLESVTLSTYPGFGADGTGSELTVNSNVTIKGHGGRIDTSNSGKITVNGNVTFNDDNGTVAAYGGQITVNGNVTFTGENSYVSVDKGGIVIINGTLTNDPEKYVSFFDDASGEHYFKPKSGHIPKSTKTGYREYTDGTSSIFIKIPDSLGNIMYYVIVILGILVAIFVLYFVLLRKRRSGGQKKR
jgi:hypothetical protein